MKNENIKWACIQPLTGGMYIGAENAIGHPAEWILTYKGLDEIKYDENGNPTIVANEAYLLNYLKKHNKVPKYYKMDRAMFDSNISDLNPDIYLDEKLETPDYEDLDIVVAVPVCSGLSMVTSGTQETKDARNCNMLYIANLVLRKIKPKIYIFENAPTLVGDRGTELRKTFEILAEETGYSVIYYKTDTSKHYNCQHRHRTFCIFTQKIDNKNKTPKFEFEDKHIGVIDFFKNIPHGLPNDEVVPIDKTNIMVLDYMKSINEHDVKNPVSWIVFSKHVNEFFSYIDRYENATKQEKERAKSYFIHIQDKVSKQMNWYGMDVFRYNKRDDVFPAVMFKTISSILHPYEDRFCTVREFLELMGMPRDFEWFGNNSNLNKIGQNVPVKTAEFIVGQAVNSINNWNNESRKNGSAMFYDNIKQKIETQVKTNKLF